MKLIELKKQQFTYCGKRFEERRFVSEDKKFFFSDTKSYNHVLAYKANSNGKGKLLDEIYHKGNYSSYPIYTVEEAVEKIEELGIDTEYQLLIHESHYENKKRRSISTSLEKESDNME